jgi:hypothetical protein
LNYKQADIAFSVGMLLNTHTHPHTHTLDEKGHLREVDIVGRLILKLFLKK